MWRNVTKCEVMLKAGIAEKPVNPGNPAIHKASGKRVKNYIQFMGIPLSNFALAPLKIPVTLFSISFVCRSPVAICSRYLLHILEGLEVGGCFDALNSVVHQT